MGVTRGGILVPTPAAYDYGGTPSPGTRVPRLTCDSGSTVKIVTRIPLNADIDDFEAAL